MIRRINKIVALVLIGTSICAIAPIGSFSEIAPLNIFCVEAKAAVNDNEAELATIESAMIPGKLSEIYESGKADADKIIKTGIVSEYKTCGSLSYTLDDTAAGEIAGMLTDPTNMAKISGGLSQIVIKANQLIGSGLPEYVQKGNELIDAATQVGAMLTNMKALADAGKTETLVAMIKAEATDIPVYKYTVVNAAKTAVVAQGFAAGGTLGLALSPVDTYNATEKNATYSSVALVPSLSLSGSSTYGKTINLSASGTEIICDGMNINFMDYNNKKVYAINNPVYNMLQVSDGAKTATSEDILNVISFSEVSNLKGFKSGIDLTSKGMSTTVLGISLTTKDSTAKNYKYALPVEGYEKAMLDKLIESYNLGTNIEGNIKGMIKTGTYTMIPNVSSEIDNVLDKTGISNTINGVTTGLNDLSDSMNDLTDSLNDKNDDVDDAWDKVFDRFDNDKGWGKRDGYRYYYDSDGVSLKGVQKIKGKTYYFNRIDGAMETGWQIVDGKRCYFDKNKGYELFTQWVQDGEDKYFVGEDGTVKKMQWVNDGGKNYYLKADGKMTTDWIKIEDYWYLFNKDGSMVTSTWKWSKDKWYYLKSDGAAATQWLQLGEKYYYFKDLSGALQTGWFRADGSWYCANEDGSIKKGWAESSDGVCYLDETTGKMKKNEWVTVDGQKYYFNINGIMVTGSRYIDGTKYNFNSDGSLS